MVTVYVKHPSAGKYYRATIPVSVARRVDNGVMVSCGLTVGVDKVPLDDWIWKGWAVEVSKDEWNHSGCQSECVLRGGKSCRW